MGYLKKEFFDTTDDIEDVIIHYTCSPLGTPADWTQAQSRSMPAGAILKTGVGQVAKYGPAAPEVPQHVHPRLRKKVLSLPNDVWDPAIGDWNGNYLFHYFYEILQTGGRRTFTDVLTEEIAVRDVVYLEPLGVTGPACVNWSVYDWDAPQFSPTEDPEFRARFGDDSPLQQVKFYGTPDQEAFAIAKSAVVDTLPLPRRFQARVQAPVGSSVVYRLHVGNWGLPEAQRWEAYWLDESFVMEAGMEPLVLTPLGTEVAPAPQSTVAPELLVGNPYLPFVLQAQALAAVIEPRQNLTTEAPVQPVGELVGSR